MNISMNPDEVFLEEEELIRTIAQPILETLLTIQDSLDAEVVDSTITVYPCEMPCDLPIDDLVDYDRVTVDCKIDDALMSLSDDFLEKLEHYLQQRIDEWFLPAVLH